MEQNDIAFDILEEPLFAMSLHTIKPLYFIASTLHRKLQLDFTFMPFCIKEGSSRKTRSYDAYIYISPIDDTMYILRAEEQNKIHSKTNTFRYQMIVIGRHSKQSMSILREKLLQCPQISLTEDIYSSESLSVDSLEEGWPIEKNPPKQLNLFGEEVYVRVKKTRRALKITQIEQRMLENLRNDMKESLCCMNAKRSKTINKR